jgi:hypothetical protein
VAFVAGQNVTAGEMNAELGVEVFRAGQKVRESQLDPDEFAARIRVGAELLNQVFGGGGGGGPDPDGVPADPGEALWIGHGPGSNFLNVGIGQGNDGVDNDTDHDDFTVAQIAGGLTVPGRFFLAQDGGQWWTEFRINAGAGRTSTGTDFPRSETREMQTNGTSLAAWNGATNDHRMLWTPAVTAVTAERPWVCFGQIHDASSDLVRLQTQGSSGQTTNLDIVARYTKDGDETTVVLIDNGYDVGDSLGPCELRVNAGTLTVKIDGTLLLTVEDMGVPGCYFKAGAYLQSNVHEQGEDPDDEAAVRILAGSLQVWHTGYPTPTTPVFTG